MMDGALSAFLADRTPGITDSTRWMEHAFPLQISCYCAAILPPLAFITSVRCVLLRNGAVLVQEDRTTTHILPGGRREQAEAPGTTLRREVLEETGWEIEVPRLLGFMHYHDPNPAPAGHAWPHPDFIQAVYTARAAVLIPGARLDDGYELSSVFLPVTEAMRLSLSARERFFLAAALA